MDNGPSLISSITLPPSSPSPSFSDSTPGGGSLLNGPHSYTQAPDALKVRHHSMWLQLITVCVLVQLSIIESVVIFRNVLQHVSCAVYLLFLSVLDELLNVDSFADMAQCVLDQR